jgi:hypothetical protein
MVKRNPPMDSPEFRRAQNKLRELRDQLRQEPPAGLVPSEEERERNRTAIEKWRRKEIEVRRQLHQDEPPWPEPEEPLSEWEELAPGPRGPDESESAPQSPATEPAAQDSQPVQDTTGPIGVPESPGSTGPQDPQGPQGIQPRQRAPGGGREKAFTADEITLAQKTYRDQWDENERLMREGKLPGRKSAKPTAKELARALEWDLRDYTALRRWVMQPVHAEREAEAAASLRSSTPTI